MNAKQGKSDVKDVTPEQVDAQPEPKPEWDRRNTREIPRGDNELRGERAERRGGDAVGPAKGDPRH